MPNLEIENIKLAYQLWIITPIKAFELFREETKKEVENILKITHIHE